MDNFRDITWWSKQFTFHTQQAALRIEHSKGRSITSEALVVCAQYIRNTYEVLVQAFWTGTQLSNRLDWRGNISLWRKYSYYMLVFSIPLLRTMALALLFRTTRAWLSTTRTTGVNNIARRPLARGQPNKWNVPSPLATTSRLWSATPAVRSIPRSFVPFPFEVRALSLWMYEKINGSKSPCVWVQKISFRSSQTLSPRTSHILYLHHFSINRNWHFESNRLPTWEWVFVELRSRNCNLMRVRLHQIQ